MTIGPARMPRAEIVVTAASIRASVDRQFPQYRDASITVVANGWDNVVARLGPDLCVRVPRRRSAVELAEHEVRWLPVLAPQLPVEVPEPVHRGEPDAHVPWAWSIVRWVDGEPADRSGPPETDDVGTLVALLRALSVPAPVDAPSNPLRGVPVRERDANVRRYLEQVEHPDVDRLRAIWERALGIPEHSGPATWVHGDLHPANLVTRGGRLVGVIDWGDVTAGDPAGDLQILWTWADAPVRAVTLRSIGADPDLVDRGRANALAHGLAVAASSADSPRMAAIGRWTLAQVLADAPD